MAKAITMQEDAITSRPLISIGIPTADVRTGLRRSIDSVLRQSLKDWELLIVGDHRDDGLADLATEYRHESIRFYSHASYMSAAWCINKAMVMAAGDYFTSLIPGCEIIPDRLERQIAALEGYYRACLCSQTSADGDPTEDYELGTMLFSLDLVPEIGYYNTTAFDPGLDYANRIAYAHDIICVDKEPLGRRPAPHAQVFRAKNNALSSAASNAPSDPKPSSFDNDNAHARQSVAPTQRHRRYSWIAPPSASKPKPIIASLATMPERALCLKDTLESLYEWADHVNVFVNGVYDVNPSFLDCSQVNVHYNTYNIGDRAKFFWSDSICQGYHFVCDDDIIYSIDYAERMIEKIEKYDGTAIVGVHGGRLHPGASDYYGNGRRIFSMKRQKYRDIEVDFLGTGAMAYDAGRLALKFQVFDRPNMADVLLGVYARLNGVPLICIESPPNLIRQFNEHSGGSIYAASKRNISGSPLNRRQAVDDYIDKMWPGDLYYGRLDYDRRSPR